MGDYAIVWGEPIDGLISGQEVSRASIEGMQVCRIS